MAVTPNRGYELPVEARLDLSYAKIGAALGLIDADMAAAFAALAAKAPIEDATLEGEPTAPTPLPGSSDQRIATTEFVTNLLIGFTPTGINAANINTGTLPDARLSFQVSAFGRTLIDDNTDADARTTLGVYSKAQVDAIISNLVGGAPGLLDTLYEFAQALGNDPNFAATITTSLAGKISNSLLTTQGDLIVRGASAPQRLGKGTARQHLRMNAGGTMPEWGGETYDSGYRVADVVLNSGTITNGASLILDLSTYIAAGFTRFELVADDLVSANDNVALQMAFSTNAGSTFLSTGYRTSYVYAYNGANSGVGNSNASQVSLLSSVGNNANEVTSGRFDIRIGAARCVMLSDIYNLNSSGDTVTVRGNGAHDTAGINAIRLAFSAGNIASGKWTLIGKRSS